MISRLWAAWGSTIEFTLVNSLFALSTYAALAAGILSLASTPIAAVAGYSALVMTEDYGIGIEIILLVGCLVGMATAYLFGLLILRLESHWIALATIALVLIVRVLVLNFVGITGGSQGRRIGQQTTTWHILVVLLLAAWVFLRHRRSRFGLAVATVRINIDLAGSLGMNSARVRMTAFLLSGGIAGVGGALFANLLQYLGPDSFYVNLAFIMLASVVLGGAYHWLGAIVGATVFSLLPEVIKEILPEGERIALGFALILVMIYLPRGLVEPGRRQRRREERAQRLDAEQESRSRNGDETAVVEREIVKQVTGLPLQSVKWEEQPAAISIRNVSKHYGGVAAVKDLSFEIPKGSIFGIVGPNGAGKTTILSLVSGLARVDNGTIYINDVDYTSAASHEIARAGIGRTFQTIQVVEELTVLENIMTGFHSTRNSYFFDAIVLSQRDRNERRENSERARELMEKVGIIGTPDQFANTLSYANQRRLEIARALAGNPEILLLDEPTAGMHKYGTMAIGDLLIELKERGLTLVVIEHNMELILNYCECAAVMNFGEILGIGEPRDVMKRPDVIEAYFGNQADADRIESLVKLR
mgnify:CR=1 FL=1